MLTRRQNEVAMMINIVVRLFIAVPFLQELDSMKMIKTFWKYSSLGIFAGLGSDVLGLWLQCFSVFLGYDGYISYVDFIVMINVGCGVPSG